MKASIDQIGMLTIKAENELEVYALSKWIEKYLKDDERPDLCIETGLE